MAWGKKQQEIEQLTTERDNLERALRGAYSQIVQTRMYCVEAIQMEEVIKTPETRAFVRSLGHQLRSIEHPIEQALDIEYPAPKSEPEADRPGDGHENRIVQFVRRPSEPSPLEPQDPPPAS